MSSEAEALAQGFGLSSLQNPAQHTVGTMKLVGEGAVGTSEGHRTCALTHVLLGEQKMWSGWWWGGRSLQVLSALQARSFVELSGRVKIELSSFPGAPGSGLHLHMQGLQLQSLIGEPTLLQVEKTKTKKMERYYINNKFNKNFKNGPHQKAESLKNAPVTYEKKLSSRHKFLQE